MELDESKREQIKIDYEQKTMLTILLKDMAYDIAKCFREAIKYAHEISGITYEQFVQDILQRGYWNRNGKFNELIDSRDKNGFIENQKFKDPYNCLDELYFSNICGRGS